MEMTRLARFVRPALLALATLASLSAGCNKPSKPECREAIANMRSLMGTDVLTESDTEGWVRRCNGGSKKEAVLCAIKATTMDELRACKFMHLPNGNGVGDRPIPGETTTPSMTPAGSNGGSAAGSSAGSGASAATGSNVGSAAPAPNAGITTESGSGSAGSNATGSAAPASGSAAPASGSGGAAAGPAAPTTGGAGSGAPAPSMGGAGSGSAH